MPVGKHRFFTTTLALGTILLLASCAKKTTVAKAPEPPAPAPTATLSASPSSIEQGQSSTLTWQTSNATEITIDGLGTVPASGSRTVTPSITTNYTLAAKGPGGEQNATASVNVSAVTVRAEPPAPPQPSDEELFRQAVKDVFFDFDKSEIRVADKAVTEKNADFLVQHPNLRVVVEGHCDDRGSAEYNLALGESRARAVREALVAQGISADRIKTVSYGKEQPFCNQEDEACWQQNRRDHFNLQH